MVIECLNEVIEIEGPVCTLIIQKCSVCGKFIGVVDGQGNFGISHSYCPRCFEAEMARI